MVRESKLRIGIVGWLHESNTFLSQPTTLERFQEETLITGEAIRERFVDSHHEIGGFFAALDGQPDVDILPIFAARALPSGAIAADAYEQMLSMLLDGLADVGPLDGLLAAPHGATVSELHRDADGHWLMQVRLRLGDQAPIIATLDAHANLSEEMVQNCNAIIAYRSNPHLDQKARGVEAANLLLATLRDEVTPTMAAILPPMAINIEKQCTDEPQWSRLLELAAHQREHGALSNSILLGFPYSDVEEMGSAVLAITDDSPEQAAALARALAIAMWEDREAFVGEFLDVPEAIAACERLADAGPVCLLDMGDNVGGGSAADGTFVLEHIQERELSDCFVCLCDPQAVAQCQEAGADARIDLTVGGKIDRQHGEPVTLSGRVVSFHEGRFQESEPRHGGMTHFDQGSTAVFRTDYGSIVMLTSKRMTPFSLQQLRSCDLDPRTFRILVAKGVNAPLAAYREVCSNFIRVNTPGSTCADMRQLQYVHRRKPLFPLETDFDWEPATARIVAGSTLVRK